MIGFKKKFYINTQKSQHLVSQVIETYIKKAETIIASRISSISQTHYFLNHATSPDAYTTVHIFLFKKRIVIYSAITLSS